MRKGSVVPILLFIFAIVFILVAILQTKVQPISFCQETFIDFVYIEDLPVVCYDSNLENLIFVLANKGQTEIDKIEIELETNTGIKEFTIKGPVEVGKGIRSSIIFTEYFNKITFKPVIHDVLECGSIELARSQVGRCVY